MSEVSVENLLLTNDPKDGNNTSSAVQTLLVGQWTRYRLVGDLIRELDRFEGMCHCTELVGVYRVSQECWLDNSTHLRSLDLRENVRVPTKSFALVTHSLTLSLSLSLSLSLDRNF